MRFLHPIIHLATGMPPIPLGAVGRQGGPSRAAPVDGPIAAEPSHGSLAAGPGTSAPARTAPASPSGAATAGPVATAPLAPLPTDPEGVRVVPYRPDGAWPAARRLHPRVYDPFRAFPRRAIYLTQMMYPRDPRD